MSLIGRKLENMERHGIDTMYSKGLVSVLMGIYNCEDCLHKSIESIIAQTYKDWEIIMCDDGSQDGTYMIAKKYAALYPHKIKLIRNSTNMGLNKTLNKCLALAAGEFVARQDADDVSMPERFEKEVEYLKTHQDIAFVSTGMIVNDGRERIGIRLQAQVRPAKKGFMKSNQFYHAPVMIRKEAITNVGGYSESRWLLRVEDYNLWTKLYAAGYIGENIMEGLYEVWEDDATYNRRKFKYRINGAYAKILAIKMLHLNIYNYIFVLEGLLKGIVPKTIYRRIHSGKIKKSIARRF